MPVLSLPLTFTNSFWTQDYRKGLEVLYEKLEQGVAEDDEIVAFIRARIAAENTLAASLTSPSPTGPRGTGFDADDGVSLLMAFRGLQAESASQGSVHRAVAKELEQMVADPFDEWSQGHKARLRSSRGSLLDGWVKAYETSHAEILKLKQQYLSKTQKADEAEDDARFAPNSEFDDKYTLSPKLNPRDSPRQPPQRTPSVSERIAQRLKDIQRRTAPTVRPEDNESAIGSVTEIARKVDKGKGKEVATDEDDAVVSSPPPMSPALPARQIDPSLVDSVDTTTAPHPILVAGLALPPSAISNLFRKAAAELPLRSVRFPLLGEYKDCFSGQEFADWLLKNVPGLQGDLDKADEAAKDLTERDGLLRRVGELGNMFEYADDAFYQFRSKAFELSNDSVKSSDANLASPRSAVADNLFKTSTSFANLVTKALNQNNSSQPPYIRARLAADEADQAYRVAVRKLDRQRLGLEERIEDTLKMLQKSEAERLRAVKTVLLQYQGVLATMTKGLDTSFERSSTLIASYQPEPDLNALIERYRTGPFRPDAHVYESVSHDEADVVFGIDLRKWAEGDWNSVISGEEKKEPVPPVLTAVLAALTSAYPRLTDDGERRKTWIYEVPLTATHHLRENLNAVPAGQPIPAEMLQKYDAPVLASAVKLWLLELDPPLALYEGWDDFRKIYPSVGALKTDDSSDNPQRIRDLQSLLLKLPKIHLMVLDTVVKHIKTLIDSTDVEESKEVFVTKLALAMGRGILRPRLESHITVQDRHPTLLFIDLITHYDELLPPTITRKKRESDRRVPIRKRTAPIDLRLSRSRINPNVDAMALLNAQRAAQNPSITARDAPPVPPLPAGLDAPPLAPLSPPAEAEAVPPVSEIYAEPETTVPEPVNATPPAIMSPASDSNSAPPRPMFREPPPEPDDAAPPMPPRFVEPLSDSEDAPAVVPPTPPVARSPSPPRSSSNGSPKISPRSPASPSSARPEERVLGTGKASLSRSGSGQTSSLVRGPRPSGGRPTSGNVTNLVSQLNKRSSSPTSPSRPGHISRLSSSRVDPHDYEPKKRGGRTSAGMFSRRTVASDAEDEVVEK